MNRSPRCWAVELMCACDDDDEKNPSLDLNGIHLYKIKRIPIVHTHVHLPTREMHLFR